MLLRKIKYGCIRLFDEFRGKEDYWHLRLKPIHDLNQSDKIYFHDMSGKGYYPGEIEDGIPIFYLNGHIRVLFYTTILNYGLGLLNRFQSDKSVKGDLTYIAKWLMIRQKEDGSWRYDFSGVEHPLANGKAAGMTQGLAISFLLRCAHWQLVDIEQVKPVMQKALSFMLSDTIVSKKQGHRFIEEFYVPGVSILNGAIFALYGLYDYCKECNDMNLFKVYIDDLKALLPQYRLFYWSYYDLKGTIASRFYHRLHIDMMEVLYKLTEEQIFLEYARKWKKGLHYSFIFIFIKAIQKCLNISKMDMSFANKSH